MCNKRVCKATGKGFGFFGEKDLESASTCLNGARVKDLEIKLFLYALKLDFSNKA